MPTSAQTPSRLIAYQTSSTVAEAGSSAIPHSSAAVNQRSQLDYGVTTLYVIFGCLVALLAYQLTHSQS